MVHCRLPLSCLTYQGHGTSAISQASARFGAVEPMTGLCYRWPVAVSVCRSRQASSPKLQAGYALLNMDLRWWAVLLRRVLDFLAVIYVGRILEAVFFHGRP